MWNLIKYLKQKKNNRTQIWANYKNKKPVSTFSIEPNKKEFKISDVFKSMNLNIKDYLKELIDKCPLFEENI